MCAQRILKSDCASSLSNQTTLSALTEFVPLIIQNAPSEDSVQSGRMRRQILIFTGAHLSDGTVSDAEAKIMRWLTSGTQHRNDVDSTLIRRLDVESMLCRGCFNIVWPLGINYPQTTNASILYKGRPCMYLPLTH